MNDREKALAEALRDMLEEALLESEADEFKPSTFLCAHCMAEEAPFEELKHSSFCPVPKAAAVLKAYDAQREQGERRDKIWSALNDE